jgi:hypothetical protein
MKLASCLPLGPRLEIACSNVKRVEPGPQFAVCGGTSVGDLLLACPTIGTQAHILPTSTTIHVLIGASERDLPGQDERSTV